MRISKHLVCWLLVLSPPYALQAHTASSWHATKSPKQFVQRFYDWYVPLTLKRDGPPAWMLALKYKKAAFSSELVQGLQEDSVAQAKAKGVIVGLDYDPILNAQDPCERYEVRSSTQEGQSYRVEIHGVGGCETHTKPDVIAELVHKNGTWVFVNFHNPRHRTDLLAQLKLLRADRQKDPQ